MGKVKQWAEDTAEKAVDTIIDKLKNKVINVETAKNEILKVDNIALCSIDEFNIDDEEIQKQLNIKKNKIHNKNENQNGKYGNVKIEAYKKWKCKTIENMKI